jgi:hypothetical protein
MERYLVERLSMHAQKFDQIRVSLLVDFFRGTRFGKKDFENS